MATKNIVPNADTEGQLGTSTKGWGKIFLGGAAANIDVNDVSGTNTAGKSLTLISGASTGNGAGGSIVFQTAAAGESGTSVNSHATVLTLDSTKAATFVGNVGIGIAPSANSLHIFKSDPILLIQSSNTSGDAELQFFPRDGSNVAHLQSIKGEGSSLVFSTGGAANDYVPTPKLTIASNGLVTLDSSIVLDDNEGLFWGATSGSNEYVVNNGSDLILGTGGSPKLTISSTGAATFSGQVSIGTTAPAWGAFTNMLNLQSGSIGGTSTTDFRIFQNMYYDGGSYRTRVEGESQRWDMGSGALYIYTAASDAANAVVTPTLKFSLLNSGAATFSGSVTANQIFSTTTAAGYAATLTNTNGASDSNGLLVKAGSTASEYVVRFANKTDTSTFFTVKGTGAADFTGVTSINASNAGAVFGVTNTSETTPYGMSIVLSSGGNNTSEYFIGCGDGDSGRFYVWSNGNVQNSNNSYGAISDVKLKENISDATPKLDDLLKVKVKNFNFIGDDTKQIGVIAQELEEIFPSMIEESPDREDREVTDEEGNVTTEKVDLGTTTKSVKYSVFTPMLIKAIQEQQTIIEDLKLRIETLEG